MGSRPIAIADARATPPALTDAEALDILKGADAWRAECEDAATEPAWHRPASSAWLPPPPRETAPAGILLPDGTPATAPGPPLLSIAELRALPTAEHEWIVEDLLPAAGMSMLDADPKAGKTTLLATLAVAVAHGDRFLGRATTEGPVLTLAFEEREDAHFARLDKLGVTDDSPIYSLCGFLPGDLDRLAWVRSHVARHGPRLIIVDTLPRLVELPEVNEYGAVTAALEPWIALARSSGAHLLFAVHARKSGGEFGKSILGSAALAAAPDVLLSIKRDESDGVRRLSSEARYGTALEPTELVLDPETGRVELGESGPHGEFLRVRKNVLAAVDGAGEAGIKHGDLERGRGKNMRTTRNVIEQLVAGGEITCSKSTTGGRVYRSNLLIPSGRPVPSDGGTEARDGFRPAVSPTGRATAGTESPRPVGQTVPDGGTVAEDMP